MLITTLSLRKSLFLSPLEKEHSTPNIENFNFIIRVDIASNTLVSRHRIIQWICQVRGNPLALNILPNWFLE